ncbi:MAG: hypothetical protein WBD40_12875 [Tepidisphaeraceae bacterium]
MAIALTGSYVWFRVAQAREQADSTATTVPTTAPAVLTPGSVLPGSKSGGILPGSKSFVVLQPPSTTAPAAAPTTAPRRDPNFLIYSSKSAPVDLIPRATTAPSK